MENKMNEMMQEMMNNMMAMMMQQAMQQMMSNMMAQFGTTQSLAPANTNTVSVAPAEKKDTHVLYQ